MADFLITPQLIYEQTNGGLDIILRYYPQAEQAVRVKHHKFSVREEKTPSCTLKEHNGVWWVKDFGSGDKASTAIDIVMREETLGFADALIFIIDSFNLESPDETKRKIQFKFEAQTLTAEDTEDKVTWEVMPYTIAGMKTIFAENIWSYLSGINLQAGDGSQKEQKSDDVALRNASALCEKYHLKEILWYRKVKRDDKGELTAHKITSTDTFPMFMFDEGQWQKFYFPKAQPYKRKNGTLAPAIRFFSAGKKPEHYMFGFQQAFNKLNDEQEAVKDRNKDAKDAGIKREEIVPEKLNEIIICTGGSDALNIAALGYSVVWLNSETAELRNEHYHKLVGISHRIFNLPDIDETGKREALAMAKEYLTIATIYLPDELRSRYDLRGKPCKDVRDFFRYFKNRDFDNLLKSAYPLRFWDSDPKMKRDGTPVIKMGRQVFEYRPNNELIYNFLYRLGFGLLEMLNEKKGESMVQIDNNVVKRVEFRHVNKFVKDFLKSETVLGLIKDGHIDLINAFHRSPNFSESSLTNLQQIKLSFADYGKDFQYMFFRNQVWKIKADGIEVVEPKKCQVYVWEDEVIDHDVKKLDDCFRIFKDDQNNYDIEILNGESVFLKFLINSSRVHWRTELEDNLDKLTKTERDKYLEENKWTVNGRLLTYEQRLEQKMILISKLLSFGYLLHRFKDPAKAFCVWVMDYSMNQNMDEDQSSGGTGKSMAYGSLEKMMRIESFEGRAEKLTQNPHIFEQVTEHTDGLMVDDAGKYFDFNFFYTLITGFLRVNPKGTSSFTIPKEKAPKLIITSNFAPRKNDKSTRRRMWFTLFSDYYHKNANGEYREEREPSQEFNMSFFAEDFPEKEWNLYFNLLGNCTKAWLNHGKIDSAENNVLRNIYKNQMGPNFEMWADIFFAPENERLDDYTQRTMAYEDYCKRFNQKGLSAQKFMDMLEAWCRYNEYVLNPNECRRIDKRTGDPEKRITKWAEKMEYKNGEWVAGKKESVEMIYICTDIEKITKPTNEPEKDIRF